MDRAIEVSVKELGGQKHLGGGGGGEGARGKTKTIANEKKYELCSRETNGIQNFRE